MQESPVDLAEIRAARPQDNYLLHCCRSGQLFRDRYRIVRVLGRGGFGVTYLAQNMALPGTPLCVVKQLCPKISNSLAMQRARVRFKREAQILSKLGSHSQIPQLLDYFTIKGEFYLVQEFIQGDTLRKEVQRFGRQPEAQVKQFLREILPVIKFVHRHQIIHRDIKPPNIIRCREDQRLVLIDFGAVREYLSDDDSLQAPMTQFVGTPGFSPPEQLALRPCFASDIYALGMTSLFMLTGKSPIEFDTDPSTGEVQWQRFASVSSHFASMLTKMLQPLVDDRYQSVEEVERTLALEPHLDSLADCMTLPHATPSTPPIQNETVVPMNTHLTHTQREAAAIRRWRARRASKQFRQHRTGLSTTGTMSPF